ncbi:MAG: hypothetical protein IKI95_03225 [Clostridia bacterium]|nr:hypothetical protein [Clostridia bacterium]
MEERNIKALEELTKQSDEKYIELLKNNQLTKILRAIGLFPDQTITNDVLIITQKPEATCVKRMRDWNYYKRSVNKNEKAIKVISHYIEKYDQDFTDEQGNIYTKGVEKLKTDLGYLFNISQTNGKEYDYLNSNRENLAKHFDVVKSALERTARDYEFVYTSIDEPSKIDKENKKVYIQGNSELYRVLDELITNVTTILLDTRRPEGLTDDKLSNIADIELNAAIYAITEKLGNREGKEYDFSEISKLDEKDMYDFKGTLQRVRSVVKQELSNVERAIEKAVRNLSKVEEKVEEKEQEVEKVEEVKQEAEVAPKPKRTRKTKQAESEVE